MSQKEENETMATAENFTWESWPKHLPTEATISLCRARPGEVLALLPLLVSPLLFPFFSSPLFFSSLFFFSVVIHSAFKDTEGKWLRAQICDGDYLWKDCALVRPSRVQLLKWASACDRTEFLSYPADTLDEFFQDNFSHQSYHHILKP